MRRTLQAVGVQVLDGEAVEVHGIGIAGAKGFAGGFGRASLGSWGETAIKQFVNEAPQEAFKLESALAKLRTPHRIALLHYAPIAGTVQGEPPEIFAFLGSSRLEDPLLRYPWTWWCTGTPTVAHLGRPHDEWYAGLQRGQAAAAAFLPDRPPFRLLRLPARAPNAAKRIDARKGRSRHAATAVRTPCLG